MLRDLYELGINKNIVADWNNYMREICAPDLLANPMVIGGPNTNVEVDRELVYLKKNSPKVSINTTVGVW